MKLFNRHVAWFHKPADKVRFLHHSPDNARFDAEMVIYTAELISITTVAICRDIDDILRGLK